MSKKLSLLLATLLCLVCIFCACTNNSTLNKGRKINSVNHRGYEDAPENTLSAFRMSAEMGFSMVECDISFTKDGVPVLLHDKSVERTSDGEGEIRELTFEEVRLLDFGSWKDEKYAGEKIPTVREFLQLCSELNLHPYLEVKDGATESEIKLLAELVLEADIDVTWISFEKEILQQLAEIFPKGRFGYLVHFVTDLAIERALEISTEENYVFIDCLYVTLTDSQIQCCQANSLPVEVWTINNKRKLANVNPYISGITSDSLNAEEVFAGL